MPPPVAPAAPAAPAGDDGKRNSPAPGEARATGGCVCDRDSPGAARAARERGVSKPRGIATFPPTAVATFTGAHHAGIPLRPPLADDSARTLGLTASGGVQREGRIIDPRASAQPRNISISANQLRSCRPPEALDRALDTDGRAALTTAPANRRAATAPATRRAATAPPTRRAATNAGRARTSAPLLAGTGTARMTRPERLSARTGLDDGRPLAATGKAALTAGGTGPASRTRGTRATLALAVASASALTRPAAWAACDSAARTRSTR
jgi:hypothetical protein